MVALETQVVALKKQLTNNLSLEQQTEKEGLAVETAVAAETDRLQSELSVKFDVLKEAQSRVKELESQLIQNKAESEQAAAQAEQELSELKEKLSDAALNKVTSHLHSPLLLF